MINKKYLHKLVSYSWDGDKEYGFVLEANTDPFDGTSYVKILNQRTKQTHKFYLRFGILKVEE